MSDNTRCFLNISLRHFVSNTNKPKLHKSCSTKSKPYSMLQIKDFLCCVLKKSFVIHLCCLKNIVLEKLTISRTAIYLLIPTTHSFAYLTLYTNVPLDETITICADTLYCHSLAPTSVPKNVFLRLMHIATKMCTVQL